MKTEISMKKRNPVFPVCLWCLAVLLPFSCATVKENENSVPAVSEEKDDEAFQLILTQYRLGNYSEVIIIIDGISPEDPYSVSLLSYIKGLAYLKLELYRLALDSFFKVGSDFPVSQELYNNMGVCFYRLGDPVKASEYFITACRIDPGYETARTNYELVDTILSADQSGSEMLYSLPHTNPATVNLLYGWMNYYMGNYPEAVLYYQRALELEPDYVMGYISLGILYDSARNHSTALDYYSKALELDPVYPDLWNDIGVAYYNLADFEKAEEAFLKAAELNEFYCYPYNNLGFLYLARNRINNAENYFTKALELNRDDSFLKGETFAGLAFCAYYNGDSAGATAFKENALVCNPSLSSEQYLTTAGSWTREMIEIFLEKIP